MRSPSKVGFFSLVYDGVGKYCADRHSGIQELDDRIVTVVNNNHVYCAVILRFYMKIS